jgi:hypothetical protein
VSRKVKSHLEFDELAFNKPENQAGLAGADIPEKNLVTQSNRARKRVSASIAEVKLGVPHKTGNPNPHLREDAIFKRSGLSSPRVHPRILTKLTNDD